MRPAWGRAPGDAIYRRAAGVDNRPPPETDPGPPSFGPPPLRPCPRGNVLPPRAPPPLRRDRRGQPGPRRGLLRVLRQGLRGRRPHGPREGAHRAGRLARRPVPLLHRRLHGRVAGEGGGPRADDGGRPRGLRHPRRRLARPRPPDDGPREGAADVGVPACTRACVHALSSSVTPLPVLPAPEGPRPATSLRARRAPLAAPAERRAALDAFPLGGGRSGTGDFEADLAASGWDGLGPAPLEVFQINVGKLCNMTCRHCHVDAGPDRTEENMDRA